LFSVRSTLWEVKSYADYRASPASALGDVPATRFYAQVNATGQTCAGSRFPLTGGRISVTIWARDIFLADELRQYRFEYELAAPNLHLRSNSLTSGWEDVEELLAKGAVVAFKDGGQDDVTPDVRKILHDLSSRAPETGASLRWGVQAPAQGKLCLVLQCLPRPAAYLRRDARLTADFCSGIELFRLDLHEAQGTSPRCGGLRPILFSRDPDRTRAELDKDDEPLQKGKR
jgi:hypothetical protein